MKDQKPFHDLFMDIADLKTSVKFLALCTELLELRADVEALSSLVSLKYDSYAVEAAMRNARTTPGYRASKADLEAKAVALKKAQDDPQARLQAMFKAKMEGKL